MKFIEQGHVRVGSEVVTDPAFLVTRYALFFSCICISLAGGSGGGLCYVYNATAAVAVTRY